VIAATHTNNVSPYRMLPLTIEDTRYSKCANPSCASRFNFREGQIARIVRSESGAFVVKHLWLCKECSKLYFLDCRGNQPRLVSARRPVFVTLNKTS
jgi:hypothetical protein